MNELLNQIAFGDLKTLLQDYVTNQASNEKVTKLHYNAGPLTDIIGTDCLKLLFGFLNYRDMCSISGVSMFFNRSLKKKKDIMMNAKLLESTAFIEYLYGKVGKQTFRIGHQLKYRYDYPILNQFSFRDLGRRGILRGDDITVWEICNHFKLKTQLIPWFLHWEEYHPICSRGAFRDVDMENAEESDDYEVEWNVLNGSEETEYNNFNRMSLAVEIVCRDRKWRDKFISENLRGNMFDKLLAVIPAFAGYRKWDKSDDYTIGYFLQNVYHNFDEDLRAHSFEQLGSQGLLYGLDDIVYRLIRHFGFKTKKFLTADFEDVRLHPKRDDGDYFVLELDDDLPNWKPRDWQKTFSEQLLGGTVTIAGVRSAIRHTTFGSRIVYQINCPSLSEKVNRRK